MSELEEKFGKYFSIIESQDSIIVIYKIERTPNNSKGEFPKYTIERLDSIVEYVGENKKRTFFVEKPAPDGNHLLIFTFRTGQVIVNSAFLDYDSVIVSKKNIKLDIQVLYNNEAEESKEFIYTPDVKRKIAIIDTETGEEVEPYVYMDEKSQMLKGKFRLKPQHKYFCFEVKEKNINL